MAPIQKNLRPRDRELIKSNFCTEESTLSYMCENGEESSLDAIKERCLEISGDDTNYSFRMPMNHVFCSLIFLPIRQANRCYSLGNYLAALALCGFATERLAYILCEINGISTRTKENKKGNVVGEIYYDCVMKKLRNSSPPILQSEELRIICEIRSFRNKYLHIPINEEGYSMRIDAKECYRLVCSLFELIFRETEKDGEWHFENRALEEYVNRQNLG